MIRPTYSVSFLLSINIFVWQNVLYFPNDLRTMRFDGPLELRVPMDRLCLGSCKRPHLLRYDTRRKALIA